MKPFRLSSWDRAQLRLLRLLGIVLGLMDDLLHVQWGERILTRMAARWQSRLAQLDQELEDLAQERHDADLKAQALSVYAAALYLGRRQMAHGELTFDPSQPRDEEILDATIELLVKERLAAIETVEVEPGRYTYTLEPDWVAIRACLSVALDHSKTGNDDWLREGLEFIDEALLPETGESATESYQE
ncbi:MAG: hypothetical protein M8467_19210 [Anaerolineae bacterium]|nr:hypothetical protein [Anaerolineae bacterium]